MKRKKNIERLFFVLCILFVFSIFSNIIFMGKYFQASEKIEILNSLNKKLQADNNSLKNISEEDIEEICDKYYAEKIIKIINEEDLNFMAQRQWEYEITINGKKLTSPITYIEGRTLRVVLKEIGNNERILPNEILQIGTITGGDPNDIFDSHFKGYSDKEFISYVEESQYGRKLIYELKDIDSGTQIYFKLSPVLIHRMNLNEKIGLNSSTIEIIKK